MNHLYYGDNLDVLRKHVPDESVDLIYLDPPFNSNADYNALFKGPKGQASPAQMDAFTDTWQWDDAVSGQAVAEIKRSSHQDAAAMLDAMVGFLGKNALTAYLAMMAVRLVELHRVLKPTGSLYLHCDPTASHYLKILLDSVFGAPAFTNEIIWKRTTAHNSSKRFSPIHDTILFYTKGKTKIWNAPRTSHDEAFLNRYYKYDDGDGKLYWRDNLTGAGKRTGESGKPWRDRDPTDIGRHWAIPERVIAKLADAEKIKSMSVQEKLDLLDENNRIYWPKGSGMPQFKRYREDLEGVAVGDLWDDIERINPVGNERLGYPTQKPVALLERILSASSNPGDVVLDPFCGCGTTVHAAQKLGRRWIGIDITHLAIGLIETRLRDAFPGIKGTYRVHGTPMDVEAARDFFDRDDRTKKQFEKWAVSQIGFIPQDKKGADGGLDGVVWFGPGKAHKAVVSVKGGKSVTVEMMRSLDAVVTREKAQVGVLLSLEPPTKGAVDWARQAGVFEVPGYTFVVPRLQVVTVEEAMRDREDAVKLPLRHDDTFKKAPKEEARGGQGAFDL